MIKTDLFFIDYLVLEDAASLSEMMLCNHDNFKRYFPITLSKNKSIEDSLKFIKEKNTIRCIIEDNGVGREAAMKIKDRNAKTHKSMGISITKNRLEVLNKSDEFKVSVKINDVYLEDKSVGGTQVEIIIPID